MNSFALLQDDVEDVSDVSLSRSKAHENKKIIEERPAESVQDAHAEGDSSKTDGGAHDKDHDDKQKQPPKEKEMSLDEYFQKKAQLSSALTSLNSKAARKANDGAGFEKMSVLKKVEEAEVFDGVPVKEFHENKGLKDSTQAAVAKNAEIQSFFKRDPADKRGGRGRADVRRGDGRRDFYRGRGRGRGGGPDGRFNGRMEHRRDNAGRGDREFRRDNSGREIRRDNSNRGERDFRRENGNRGERDFRRDNSGRVERDFRRDNRNGYGRRNDRRGDGPDGDGPRHPPAPTVPIVPNVDDTAAFPSL